MRLNFSELEIKHPFYQISSDFDNITKFPSKQRMQIATRIAVNERSMVGSYVFDGDNKLYIIIDIKDFGERKKRSFYDFVFRNPLHKIDPILEIIDDKVKLNECTMLLKKLKDSETYSKKHEE